MSGDLLQTKLYVPRLRPFLVPRPHLIEKLNVGLDGKLTLISAPAGFGKTTLIAEWIHNSQFIIRNSQSAWLSLDESDNDPTRFLTYFVAALQTIAANLGEGILVALQSPQPPTMAALLTTLINQISAIPDDPSPKIRPTQTSRSGRNFVLVLDDYHLIAAQPVHAALTFLLDHLPGNMHLVMATRSDPPLPLARLRGRGLLTELRATDLRFTRDEAAQFINQVMGLELLPADVTALTSRTEGWIAGLQLAALSMRGREDFASFVAAFTGSNRFILDYLVEEVLQSQPDSVQTFLLHTAVLDRLTAPLCDAILEHTDAEARQRGEQTIATSQDTLEHLERANLFIVPLDDERRWYRYHHLFADLLRNRLQRANPDHLPVLHRRAAGWYATNGDPREAVHHALAAKEYRLTARIIQDNWRRLFHQGWINTTLHWLESLPPDLLRRLPPLSIAYCWSLSLRGDFSRIPSYLTQAETAFRELVAAGTLSESHPEYVLLSGQLHLLRSMLARSEGDPSTAINYAEQTLSEIARVEAQSGIAMTELGYGAALIQLGYAYLAAGDLAQAALNFGQSRQYARQSENFIAMCTCAFELARIRLKEGRLSEAEAICQETLALADQPEYADWPAFFIVHIGLADVLRALGRPDEAELHLQQGLASGRRSGHILYLAHGYLAAERLYQAQGEETQAQSARQQAEQLLNQVGLTVGDLPLEGTAVSQPSSAARQLIEPLTAREQDVLRLIAAGLSNREIGAELYLSLNTIKTHTKTLYGKLNVHTRTQAVNKARELGLLVL